MIAERRSPIPAVGRGGSRPAPRRAPAQAAYLAHDAQGLLLTRRAVLRETRVDVRAAWARSAALAWDFMANNGWVAGASDQAIADVVGTELQLAARPSLDRLGYDEREASAWCRLVEDEWWLYVHDRREVDAEGKATLAELLDGALRYYLAEGEAFGVLDFMLPARRAQLGLAWGTKLRLTPPHRCRGHTAPFAGWEDGIRHDDDGRPIEYRFQRTLAGFQDHIDLLARAGPLLRVVHAMDRGATPNGTRGISPLAPVFMTVAQSDQLANATLTTALLQTLFAATIRSPEPTDNLVYALDALAGTEFDGARELAEDIVGAYQQRIESLRSNELTINGSASRVNHLAPGEEFEIHGTKTPGPEYLPFARDLRRELARGLGVMYEAVTLDYTSATYSSVRMGVATIWPITVRRRARIAAPIAQALYEAWLDEAIATGRIPLKGGYRALQARRAEVCAAEWRGPERPTADPYKDALADKVALETNSSTLQEICAGRGLDWEDVAHQAIREARLYREGGLVAPHGRSTGGDARGGPLGAAATSEETGRGLSARGPLRARARCAACATSSRSASIRARSSSRAATVCASARASASLISAASTR